MSKCFHLCGQSTASSFLVLRLAISGLHMVKYFSFRQRLHILLEGEHGLPLAIIFHFNVKEVLLSFNVQMYWLSVVEFLLLSFLKLFVWSLYLVLTVFSVHVSSIFIVLSC